MRYAYSVDDHGLFVYDWRALGESSTVAEGWTSGVLRRPADAGIERQRRLEYGNQASSSVHAHRTVGGDLDHRAADRDSAAGSPEGPRGGRNGQVRGEPEADRRGQP